MKRFNLSNFILLLLLWSCKDQSHYSVRQDSDTTFLLNQVLNDATSDKFMPDADAVTRPYYFKDSILLTSKVITLDLLPASIGDRKFKIMTEKEILSILRKDSNNLRLPNYLIVSEFEKNDSGYYVQIQNRSALPFGGGGALGLYYIKKGDSLINIKRLASSIN
jgi:hypothetical protein